VTVKVVKEDSHFYIDNAPPSEVVQVLRVLSRDAPLSASQIAALLSEQVGFVMQKDHTYAPRRLYDLGLSSRVNEGGSVRYSLSELGAKVQLLAGIDNALGYEIMHFLHYTRFSGDPSDRKLFWSYRSLCRMLWVDRVVAATQDLAARVQAAIGEEFPHLDDLGRSGGRFSAAGANQGLAWLRALKPSPIVEASVVPRAFDKVGLVVAALDFVYRSNSLPYGSPLLLSPAIVDEVASVLFIDPKNCMLNLVSAGRLFDKVEVGQTLTGTSITLRAAHSVHDL
jgi:hypothetical protein